MTENVNKDIDQQLKSVNILISQLRDYKNKIMMKKRESDINEIANGLKDIFLLNPFLDPKNHNLKAILQYVRNPYKNKLMLVHSSDDSNNAPKINNYSSNLDDIKVSFKEFSKLANKSTVIQSDTKNSVN